MIGNFTAAQIIPSLSKISGKWKKYNCCETEGFVKFFTNFNFSQPIQSIAKVEWSEEINESKEIFSIECTFGIFQKSKCYIIDGESLERDTKIFGIFEIAVEFDRKIKKNERNE